MSYNKNKTFQIFKEGLVLVLGSAVYSVAVELFLSPLKISPGGLTGVATALNFITGFPTGVYIVLFNFPLILLGLLKFGKKFIAKSAAVVLMSSIFIEILNNFFSSFVTDRLLSAVFGGFLLGIGLGLVMMVGASTGGIDIAVKLLNKKYNISIGRAFLIMDSTVIIIASVIYGDFQSALYSLITVFVSSKTVDMLLGGINDSKAVFIITDKEAEVKSEITVTAERGITVLPAFGGYTGRKNNILLCVARNNEIGMVRNIILRSDPNAFFFIVSAGDVVGKGFK